MKAPRLTAELPSVLHEVRFTPALAEELMQILRMYRFTALPPTDSEHAMTQAVDREWDLLRETMTKLGRALEHAQSDVIDSGISDAMQSLQTTVEASNFRRTLSLLHPHPTA